MLLIDCYNVLHTTLPPMLAGLDEAGICRALARTGWAGAPIVVVADGRPKPLGVTESPVPEVQLVYSGVERTADSVIIERINAHTAPRRVTVVSSDRQIRAAARRRRCRSWTSDHFVNQLVDQLRRGGGGRSQVQRPDGPLSDQQIAQWLRVFGVDADAGSRSDAAGAGAGDGGPDEPEHDDPFHVPGLWPPPDM